jgi:hypothetical protein
MPRKMTRAAHAIAMTVKMIVIACHLCCRKFLARIDNISRLSTLYPYGVAGVIDEQFVATPRTADRPVRFGAFEPPDALARRSGLHRA